jgi:hypothetical protein
MVSVPSATAALVGPSLPSTRDMSRYSAGAWRSVHRVRRSPEIRLFRDPTDVGSQKRMALKKISLRAVLLAGATASAIIVAPLASANPPPGCVNPDGTPCAVAGPGGAGASVPGAGATAGPEGANAVVPGAGATAGPEGANAVVPGAGATAGPDGATAYVPGAGATAGSGGTSVDIPGGPVGSAGPGGASGCIPYVGCASTG